VLLSRRGFSPPEKNGDGIRHCGTLYRRQGRNPKKDEPGFAASDQLYIDPVECIDCAACVPVCPVKAIFVSFDLPKKWASYEEKNAAHFGR
jgi:NAD-dependent dihydropyrimidine dehydrogenase PreA subunit